MDKRYIDADALKEYFSYSASLCEDIDKFPTADVRENVKGKWIQKSKPLDFCTYWWYECSECGSKPPNDRYGHPNYLTDYCPNCGAKMEM